MGCALMEHVYEARSRGWCVPELEEVPEGGRPQGPPRLEVKGVWPYWKDKLAHDTVRNDLVVDRIILLTGPNMAGKDGERLKGGWSDRAGRWDTRWEARGKVPHIFAHGDLHISGS